MKIKEGYRELAEGELVQEGDEGLVSHDLMGNVSLSNVWEIVDSETAEFLGEYKPGTYVVIIREDSE